MRIRSVLQQNSQNHAREPRPSAEISPGAGHRRMCQQLGAVPGMAVPEIRETVRADQIHHRICFTQPDTEIFQIRHLLRRRAGLALKEGLFGIQHQAATPPWTEVLGALFTCASRAVRAPGVMPSIRPAWPRVRGCTRASFSFTSFERLPMAA